MSTSSAEPPSVADERVSSLVENNGQTLNMSYNSQEEDHERMDRPLVDLDTGNYSVERDASALIQNMDEIKDSGDDISFDVSLKYSVTNASISID